MVEPVLTALWLLAACSGDGGGPVGSVSTSAWLPPWADRLLYREVDPAALDEAIDTGAEAGEILQIEVTGTSPTWTLEVRRGETWASAEPVVAWELRAAGSLTLEAIDGVALDPAPVLLGETYQTGEAVETGQWTATTAWLESQTTWYGTFADVLEVRVDGPTTGIFRFEADVGPVQWAWGEVGADLAWYQ